MDWRGWIWGGRHARQKCGEVRGLPMNSSLVGGGNTIKVNVTTNTISLRSRAIESPVGIGPRYEHSTEMCSSAVLGQSS